jgi:hypothetical protein
MTRLGLNSASRNSDILARPVNQAVRVLAAAARQGGEIMTANNQPADHHSSAANHHERAAGCHREASRHFKIGKDYARAAH